MTEMEMRVWKLKDCTVTEEEFDGDLHVFTVSVNWDEGTCTVYPRDIVDMNECISKLDDGVSPIQDCWENGNGTNVSTYFGAWA